MHSKNNCIEVGKAETLETQNNLLKEVKTATGHMITTAFCTNIIESEFNPCGRRQYTKYNRNILRILCYINFFSALKIPFGKDCSFLLCCVSGNKFSTERC